jgi:hypothetical protein
VVYLSHLANKDNSKWVRLQTVLWMVLTTTRPSWNVKKKCLDYQYYRTMSKSWGLWQAVTWSLWNLRRNSRTGTSQTYKETRNTWNLKKKKRIQRKWQQYWGIWILPRGRLQTRSSSKLLKTLSIKNYHNLLMIETDKDKYFQENLKTITCHM